jgi:hypothetical protein
MCLVGGEKMTVIADDYSAGPHSTNASSWATLLTKGFTTVGNAQKHRFIVCLGCTLDNKNETGHIRVTLDSTNYYPKTIKVNVANNPEVYTVVFWASLDEGAHTLYVEGYTDGSSNLSIRDVNLTVDKY